MSKPVNKLPIIVPSDRIGLWTKLIIKLNNSVSIRGTTRRLGYCKECKIYYSDIVHSDGRLDCPKCTPIFLEGIRKRGEQK